MKYLKRYRLPVIGLGIVILIGAFLAFRPDKLFLDDSVDESLADAFPSSNPAVATTAPATTDTAPEAEPEAESDAATDRTTTTSTLPTPPSGPVAVATGGFYGIDHAAAGTATIFEQDGSYVLRFEDDTEIQNGPDLYVWVLPADDYDGGDPAEYLDLGKLKGNIGGQNYELPDVFDPEVHQTVLIWCLRFGVPFAAVPLA